MAAPLSSQAQLDVPNSLMLCEPCELWWLAMGRQFGRRVGRDEEDDHPTR